MRMRARLLGCGIPFNLDFDPQGGGDNLSLVQHVRLHTALSLVLCTTLTAQVQSWTGPIGPPGGSTAAIAHLTSGQFVALTNSSFYRLNDDSSWTMRYVGGHVLCFAEYQPGLLLASSFYGGLTRSTDSGLTWSTVNSTFGVFRLKVSPKGTFFGTTDHYLCRSTDFGQTWTQCDSVPTNRLTCLEIDPQGRIFTADNMFRMSTDDGQTWQSTSFADTVLYSLTVSGGTILASGVWELHTPYPPPAVRGVWRSRDNGQTWTRVSPLYARRLLYSSEGDVFALTFDGVFRSTDDGATWNLLTQAIVMPWGYGYANVGNPDLAEGPHGEIIAFGGGLVVRISRTGGERSTLQIPGASIFSLVPVGKDRILAFTSGGRQYESDDIGRLWTLKTNWNAPAGFAYSVVTPNGTILMGSGGYLYRSIDTGSTWGRVDANTLSPRSLGCDSRGRLFLSSHWPSQLLRSTDDGNSWQPILDIPYSDYAYVDVGGDDRVYLTFLPAFTYRRYRWRSSDAGHSWYLIDSSNVPWIVGTNSRGHLYASDSQGLYRSLDGGETWGEPLFSTYASSFSWHRRPDGVILWGTQDGQVWISQDDGETWQQVEQFTKEAVSAFAFLPGGTLFVGTSSGILRGHTSLVLPVNAERPFPSSFTLLQNYPNPFNPSTTIRFALPQRSHVTLTVFNCLGQQVATLVQGEEEAGYHQVRFDGSGLSTGVYLYRLQAGSYVQTRKLLLLH